MVRLEFNRNLYSARIHSHIVTNEGDIVLEEGSICEGGQKTRQNRRDD